MAEEKDQTVHVPCPQCGGGTRNHKVLTQFEIKWRNDDEAIYGHDHYQICQCMGCERVSFRLASFCSEDYDEEGRPVPTVKVYPEMPREDHRSPQPDAVYPDVVMKIYEETIKALNCGAYILAGGGLRAIVEAICIDQQVGQGNLQQKIEELRNRGLLAQPQANLLHEERYIGNAALHEMEPPTRRSIEDGLDIIEGLLNTIYVLPQKAERLRQARIQAAAQAIPPNP